MDARTVPVRVGDCTCPDSPHPEGDEVYLSPTVSLRLGLASERVLLNAGQVGTEATEDALIETFVRLGVVGWNLVYVNGKGVPEPRPFSADVVLADWKMARSVAEKANELYAETVLAPLVAAFATPSAPGRTDATTSPDTTPTPMRRKRSSRTTSDGAR
jgi:hypothetical protein